MRFIPCRRHFYLRPFVQPSTRTGRTRARLSVSTFCCLHPYKNLPRANNPTDDDVVSRLGIEVARTISLNYSNQETSFTVGESVRDEDVFVIQSTATGDVNEGLMELLIIISACRTARCVEEQLPRQSTLLLRQEGQ